MSYKLFGVLEGIDYDLTTINEVPAIRIKDGKYKSIIFSVYDISILARNDYPVISFKYVIISGDDKIKNTNHFIQFISKILFNIIIENRNVELGDYSGCRSFDSEEFDV